MNFEEFKQKQTRLRRKKILGREYLNRIPELKRSVKYYTNGEVSVRVVWRYSQSICGKKCEMRNIQLDSFPYQAEVYAWNTVTEQDLKLMRHWQKHLLYVGSVYEVWIALVDNDFCEATQSQALLLKAKNYEFFSDRQIEIELRNEELKVKDFLIEHGGLLK